MAIRMAQDLGMHKLGSGDQDSQPESGQTGGEQNGRGPAEKSKNEDADETLLRLNLFWSIYFIDRVISLGTGRPLALRDEQISCPLPPESTSANNDSRPNPFRHMLRIM